MYSQWYSSAIKYFEDIYDMQQNRFTHLDGLEKNTQSQKVIF